jgi:hypothetical protein
VIIFQDKGILPHNPNPRARAQPQAVPQVQQVPTQEPTQQTTQQQVPPEQQQEPTSQEVPAEMPVPESPGVVVVFGRFNPPTIGHEKLLKEPQKKQKREVMS